MNRRMDSIPTKILDKVEIQQNGLIRNAKGRLIGKLDNDVPFESEHIQGGNTTMCVCGEQDTLGGGAEVEIGGVSHSLNRPCHVVEETQDTTKRVEEVFTDQFFVATDGRNDKRRSKIQSLIQQAQEEEQRSAKAEVVADLYRMRASLTTPVRAREMQDPKEVAKYNWMNVMIAKIIDEHNLSEQDIDTALQSLNTK